MPPHSFNSYISYTDPKTGQTLTYNMWVTEISQPHQLGGSSSQSKMFKHFYPKSYSPGAISVTGRVPYQIDYDNLARFIRNFHLMLMNSPGSSNAGDTQIPLMTLHIGGEGLSIEGIIGTFEAGAKRWNVAPQFQFEFLVIKDGHSLNSDMHPAYATRMMWTGNFVDEGPISFNTDAVGSYPIANG